MYKVKLTVVVSAQDSASALQRVQDRIEPKGKERAENGMYIEVVDRIESKS